MNYLLPSNRMGVQNAFVSGPPPLWTPASLSPNFWIDADDAATLYDATSGGSLITTEGSLVKRVEDKGSNGWHLTEATTPPRLVTNTRSTRRMLAFSALTKLFNASATFGMTNICMSVVYQNLVPYDNAGILVIGASGSGDDYNSSVRSMLETYYPKYAVAAGVAGVITPNPAGTQSRLKSIVLNQYGGTLKIYENGVEIFSASAVAGGTSNAGILLGTRYLSGAISSAYHMRGHIGEVILTAGLSPTDLGKLHTYFDDKYFTANPLVPALYASPTAAFTPDFNADIFNEYCLPAANRDAIWAMVDASGNGHDATQKSGVNPTFVKYEGRKFVAFKSQGTPSAFSKVHTDDFSGLNFTGETTIQMEVRLPAGVANGSNQVLVSRAQDGFTNANSMWAFMLDSTGKPFWKICVGTSNTDIVSTAALPFAANEKFFLRAHYVPDTGSGQYAVTFETSLDGTTWTQLGTTVTGSSVAMNGYASQVIELGSVANGNRIYSYALDFFSFQMWNGSTSGTLVVDFVADDGTHWSRTTIDRTGRSWQHDRYGQGLWALIGKSCYFISDGTKQYFDINESWTTAATFTAGQVYAMGSTGSVWSWTTAGLTAPHAPLWYGTGGPLYVYGSLGGGQVNKQPQDPLQNVVVRITAAGSAGDTLIGANTDTLASLATGTYDQLGRLHRRGTSSGEFTQAAWFGRSAWYDTVETAADVQTWQAA